MNGLICFSFCVCFSHSLLPCPWHPPAGNGIGSKPSLFPRCFSVNFTTGSRPLIPVVYFLFVSKGLETINTTLLSNGSAFTVMISHGQWLQCQSSTVSEMGINKHHGHLSHCLSVHSSAVWVYFHVYRDSAHLINISIKVLVCHVNQCLTTVYGRFVYHEASLPSLISQSFCTHIFLLVFDYRNGIWLLNLCLLLP
jgi:hypothetical protein